MNPIHKTSFVDGEFEEGGKMKEISPKVFGPGTWVMIHIMSMNCDNSSRDCFIAFVDRVLSRLPCKKCRKHAIEYAEKHPLNDIEDTRDLFRWSWRFHNEVNQRLGKKEMSYEDAYNMYKETEVLIEDGDCGSCNEETGDAKVVNVEITK